MSPAQSLQINEHATLQVPAFLAIFYGTFTFVLILLALIIYGVMGFTNNYFPSLAPLKLLRVMGSLAAGVLFIPLMEIVRRVHFLQTLTFDHGITPCLSHKLRPYRCAVALQLQM
jgi:uncharacterized membrane protein